MTREDIKTISDIVHKTIYGFFDICGDDEEVPITDKDKLLLEVNKTICNNIKELEQEPKMGHWIEHKWADEVDGYLISNFECSCCHTWKRDESNYCPECGAKMESEDERWNL